MRTVRITTDISVPDWYRPGMSATEMIIHALADWAARNVKIRTTEDTRRELTK